MNEDLREWIRNQVRRFRPYSERELREKGLEGAYADAGRWELLCALSQRFFGETPDKV